MSGNQRPMASKSAGKVQERRTKARGRQAVCAGRLRCRGRPPDDTVCEEFRVIDWQNYQLRSERKLGRKAEALPHEKPVAKVMLC